MTPVDVLTREQFFSRGGFEPKFHGGVVMPWLKSLMVDGYAGRYVIMNGGLEVVETRWFDDGSAQIQVIGKPVGGALDLEPLQKEWITPAVEPPEQLRQMAVDL